MDNGTLLAILLTTSIAGGETVPMMRLGLPALPEDRAEVAAMRAAGYDVLAEVDGAVTMVSVLAEDEEIQHPVSTRPLAEALGVAAADLKANREFLAVMRETPATGPVLSGFRPIPEA